MRSLLISAMLLSGGCFVEVGVQRCVVQPQLVWINFGGASNVRVHGMDAISFGPFDAAAIGPEFAGETDEIKRIIVEVIRDNYTDLEVTIISSDESPEPNDEHSVIHFGGWSADGNLGQADSVDRCNRNRSQVAVVYVESFKKFSGLGMYVEELAFALGSVASHELGHLLGRRHASDSGNFMDNTRSVWELAGVR